MNSDFDLILDLERRWCAKRNKMDRGSYCEDASPEAVLASKIITKCRELADVLLTYERQGYK